ncbi:hypothetical protein [Helcococcus massiliensis]|uniref:hypothetical protein n=1 Tax=Helcococcus massiliensis TaxID=2040290 RepID=UPI000CDEE848|nr:hypothetical protein [Helcococcus massiliensis]
MKKILIICSAGMSSSLITRKLNEKFNIEKLNYIVESTYLSEKNNIEDRCYDLILISPQIKRYRQTIIENIKFDNYICLDIPSDLYTLTDEAVNGLGELIMNNLSSNEQSYKRNILNKNQKGGSMKILLVCAGGFSTSILVNKVEKWGKENNQDIEIQAVGKSAYSDVWEKYDCILLGPQIGFAKDEIQSNVSIPVENIEPMVYALGDAEAIVKQAKSIIK